MTSKHSLQRAKERAGMNPNAAEHFIRNAIARGKRVDDFRPSREQQWLLQHMNGNCSPVTYNGYCFIITNDSQKCVTLYALPKWFGKQVKYSNKGRVRNYYKYQKFNGDLPKAG